MNMSQRNAVSTLELVLSKEKLNPWGVACQQILKC